MNIEKLFDKIRSYQPKTDRWSYYPDGACVIGCNIIYLHDIMIALEKHGESIHITTDGYFFDTNLDERCKCKWEFELPLHEQQNCILWWLYKILL